MAQCCSTDIIECLVDKDLRKSLSIGKLVLHLVRVVSCIDISETH